MYSCSVGTHVWIFPFFPPPLPSIIDFFTSRSINHALKTTKPHTHDHQITESKFIQIRAGSKALKIYFELVIRVFSHKKVVKRETPKIELFPPASTLFYSGKMHN